MPPEQQIPSRNLPAGSTHATVISRGRGPVRGGAGGALTDGEVASATGLHHPSTGWRKGRTARGRPCRSGDPRRPATAMQLFVGQPASSRYSMSVVFQATFGKLKTRRFRTLRVRHPNVRTLAPGGRIRRLKRPEDGMGHACTIDKTGCPRRASPRCRRRPRDTDHATDFEVARPPPAPVPPTKGRAWFSGRQEPSDRPTLVSASEGGTSNNLGSLASSAARPPRTALHRRTPAIRVETFLCAPYADRSAEPVKHRNDESFAPL